MYAFVRNRIQQLRFFNRPGNHFARKGIGSLFLLWGNTRPVANEIGAITGIKVFELQPATPYTQDRGEIEEVAKRKVRDGIQQKRKA